MTNPTKIGFLGGGNMNSALIAGLLRVSRAANADTPVSSSALQPQQIFVYDRNAAKNLALHNAYGIGVCTCAAELVETSDVLVLGVKPQSLKSAVVEIRPQIVARQPLLISVAAGITTSTLHAWLNPSLAIVRAMPNTPALIGEGATGLFATRNTNADQRQLATTILSAIGTCVWVESDADMDTVTALSGSGPAYFMLLTKALIRAAMQAGLSASVAQQLAHQTARGAALLMASSAKPLDVLIEDIKSPKGTTEQAINALATADLDKIVEQAFTAARTRAAQMANEFT